MRALVFTAPGTVELRDVADPEPERGETLVHVRSAGICGSELHGVRHPGFRVPPLIMGHEFTGVSDAGDPVLVNPILSCGTCDQCRGGRRQLCRTRKLVGVHRAGGFAERVAVPAEALRPLPRALDWDAGAIVEPAANAVHAWKLSGARPDSRIAVIGAGAIGLLCLLTARAEGARDVDVTDLSAERQALAMTLGAQAASLDGEYDVIFDAVGSAATRALSLRHLRPGGCTVWLGLAEPDTALDGNAVVRDEKRITGSFAYHDAEFARAAELIQDWDLSWTTRYPLDNAAEIFTSLMNGASRPVKALLRPAAADSLDASEGASGELQNANPPSGMRAGGAL